MTDEKIWAALSTLENLARQQSGRKTDLLVKDVDALYLAFESTVKREAARMADKIAAAFNEHSAREGCRAVYTITGFPDDIAEEDAYLKKVFRQEAA